MIVEQEHTKGTGQSKSEVLKEAWFYGPTFLIDDHPPTPERATLFLRRYRLVKTPKGRLIVRWLLDVEEFANESAMVAAIEDRGLKELPAEQPDRDWIPEEVMLRCPTCKSPDPTLAFDVLRPEKPIQPATWLDSLGLPNWICADPFHRPLEAP